MRTIWKYPLDVVDSQFVVMPLGAEILTVQIQNEEPYLWTLVDPHPQLEKKPGNVVELILYFKEHLFKK